MPRRLEQQETLNSLNKWKSVFRNYYRRCPYYGLFLLPSTVWDSSNTRGFSAPEPTGLKRDVQTLAADLDGFLDCIASYCPFDYVGDKLKSESVNLQTVWDILHEIYDLELSSSNFLDYASMVREPEESYRGYYNRLVGFIRQHLPKEQITAEGVSSPPAGESLSVALLDTIAIHWLLNIDKRLVNIVKTEFATQLKTKRLCQLIKTIAQNIDDLLLRYSSKDQISAVQPARNNQQYSASQADMSSTNEINCLIQRIEKLETNFKSKNKNKSRNFYQPQRKVQCSHCLFINKQLGCNLKTDHPSNSCGKKGVSISLVESLDLEMSSNPSESTSEYEGCIISPIDHLTKSLQSNLDTTICEPDSRAADLKCSFNSISCDASSQVNINEIFDVAAVSDNKCIDDYNKTCVSLDSKEDSKTQSVNTTAGKQNSTASSKPLPIAVLSERNSSSFSWRCLDKSKSPRLKCQFKGVNFSSLVDSGAEVNAIDKSLADSLKLGITSSTESVKAANQLPLEVYGQTREPLSVDCITEMGNVTLHLGIVLVIANLGTGCLIGEPAKKRNNIVCLPRHKLIIIANGNEVYYTPYENYTQKYSLVRTTTSLTLAPGESFQFQLPEQLKDEQYVSIIPRSTSVPWLQPSISQPVSGVIHLVNSSQQSVSLPKAVHVADIRDTTVADIPIKLLCP